MWVAQAAKADSDGDISDDDSNDGEEGAPVMHLRQISQSCGINRVRAMPQRSTIIATWGDDARVQVRPLCPAHGGSKTICMLLRRLSPLCAKLQETSHNG